MYYSTWNLHNVATCLNISHNSVFFVVVFFLLYWAALTPRLYHDLGMVPWYRVIMSNSLLVGVITAPSPLEHPISFQNSFGVGTPLAFHRVFFCSGVGFWGVPAHAADRPLCSHYSRVGDYLPRSWVGARLLLAPFVAELPTDKKIGE